MYNNNWKSQDMPNQVTSCVNQKKDKYFIDNSTYHFHILMQ